MAEKDYYSFDEVLSDLRMEEDELKRLVSAGEIRAFRDSDTMRFKAEDIERLRSDGGDVEELVLGDDLELDLELDESDGGVGFEVEELDLEASAAPATRPARSAAGSPQRTTPRSKAGDEPAGSEGPGILVALVLGVIVLLFANFAAFGAVSGRSNQITGFLADLFN